MASYFVHVRGEGLSLCAAAGRLTAFGDPPVQGRDITGPSPCEVPPLTFCAPRSKCWLRSRWALALSPFWGGELKTGVIADGEATAFAL